MFIDMFSFDIGHYVEQLKNEGLTRDETFDELMTLAWEHELPVDIGVLRHAIDCWYGVTQ